MEGQTCEECNGAICAFCQFNQIVNNGSKTLDDKEEPPEYIF